MNPLFMRTTVFCRNTEKSLALYRDLFGFSIVEDKTISGSAAAGLVGLLKQGALRIVLPA